MACRTARARGAGRPRRSYGVIVLPLAVSGSIVIGVVVAGAVLLLMVLFRSEDRAQAEERDDRER